MAKIIRLNDDPHAQTQQLLPWYVTGTLEPDEGARVEAHLAGCAECCEDLKIEQALARQMKSLAREPEAKDGLAALRARAMSSRPPPLWRRRIPVGWAFAQAAGLAVVVAAATFAVTRTAPPLYRALGAASTPLTGNLIVVFRPQSSEIDLRTTLWQNDARIVDGPTSTGAYVLHVTASRRDAALARLKADAHVAVAASIDGDDR